MSHDTVRRPQPATLAERRWMACVVALFSLASVVASASANAQPTRTAATSAVQPVGTTTSAANPDLQGLWDFTMRVGERTSTGFFALGPVDGAWAGSLTPDSTNTLAIRVFTVHGDSVHMVVASREGDVPFHARLSPDGQSMVGIVDYHGGARLPMTATRRARREVPRD